MNLIYDEVLLSVPIEPYSINTIVLENPKSYRMIVEEFTIQNESNQGSLKIVDHGSSLNLSKSVLLILNPYLADLNSRKFLQLTYSEISDLVNEFPENQAVVLSSMADLLSKVCDRSRFDCLDFSTSPDWDTIFKTWGLRFDYAAPGLLSTLINYLKLAAGFEQFKCIVFVGLKPYLLCEEQEMLFKMASYLQVTIILIEAAEGSITDFENVTILDNDMCEVRYNRI